MMAPRRSSRPAAAARRARRGQAAMSLREHGAIHGPLPLAGARTDRRGRPKRPARARRRRLPDGGQTRAVAAAAGAASAVVVNASETEPASAKDRLLISRLPHLVLDGAVLAAEVCGAREVIVKLGAGMSPVIAGRGRDRGARRARRSQSGSSPAPTATSPARRAPVINALNGGAAMPDVRSAAAVRARLPGPADADPEPRDAGADRADRPVRRRVVPRARHRGRSRLGAGDDLRGGGAPGRLRAGVRNADDRPAGGGGRRDRGLRALLVGGYFGTWVEVERAVNLRLAREDLRSVGCTLGSGVVIALGESACGLHESARVIDYLARQSAGQCGPCVHGLRAIADGVVRDGRGDGVARRARAGRAVDARGPGPRGLPPPGRGGALRAERARGVRRRDRGAPGARCRALPAGLPVGEDVALAAASGSGAASSGSRRDAVAMSQRIRVNPIACEAHGLCVELLPELIRLDDWGYPIIDDSRVPPELVGLAKMGGGRVPDARAAAREGVTVMSKWAYGPLSSALASRGEPRRGAELLGRVDARLDELQLPPADVVPGAELPGRSRR